MKFSERGASLLLVLKNFPYHLKRLGLEAGPLSSVALPVLSPRERW